MFKFRISEGFRSVIVSRGHSKKHKKLFAMLEFFVLFYNRFLSRIVQRVVHVSLFGLLSEVAVKVLLIT